MTSESEPLIGWTDTNWTLTKRYWRLTQQRRGHRGTLSKGLLQLLRIARLRLILAAIMKDLASVLSGYQISGSKGQLRKRSAYRER